jgi:hypothetical protein
VLLKNKIITITPYNYDEVFMPALSPTYMTPFDSHISLGE